MLFRELIKQEIVRQERELTELERRKDSEDDEWEQFADGVSRMLVEAGMVSFGKRKTVRATHTWSKSNEVQVASAKLCDAESKLIDDMQNSALMTEMSKAMKEFEAIRYEKEQEAWSTIRSKMGANESKKLLHVLLPSDRTNMNLLDIQHPDSSPCTKQEAVEVFFFFLSFLLFFVFSLLFLLPSPCLIWSFVFH